MRQPLIAGNWKMYGTPTEATNLIVSLKEQIAGVQGRDILVAPPFPVLATVAAHLIGTRILLGAQNLHWEDQGAYTGEVSGPMLRGVGCSHVIIGHSERRQYFAETDEWVARKIGAALRHRLTPIVCVGETLEEREANRTLEVIRRQLEAAVADLDAASLERLVIAYEPVWAIGTGKVATPEQAQDAHAAIREILSRAGGNEVAARIRILYGGSVKPDNVDALMKQADVDGALVGGASLKAADFARIVRFQS